MISVDSKTTRIQEIHAIVGHILCECVEETYVRKSEIKQGLCYEDFIC